MHEPNVRRVLDAISPSERVLDVGGWACPFNRAQWILDSEPFETRGFYRTFGGPPSQGGEREQFSRETWIQRDICASEPWPFEDKFFDFAVCSHTLEDVRDPIRVCKELIRVAKRGYIETPSRLFESTRGLESPSVVGLSHHRWFVEASAEELTFLMKFHFVHSDFRFSIPPEHLQKLGEEAKVLCFWWKDEFRVDERFVHGLDVQMREIEEYVKRNYRYSSSRTILAAARREVSRVGRGLRRRLGV